MGREQKWQDIRDSTYQETETTKIYKVGNRVEGSKNSMKPKKGHLVLSLNPRAENGLNTINEPPKKGQLDKSSKQDFGYFVSQNHDFLFLKNTSKIILGTLVAYLIVHRKSYWQGLNKTF